MTGSAASLVRGIVQLAGFRAEGLAAFGGSVRHVTGSLMPLLAFPACFLAVTVLAGGRPREAAELLSVIDALLVQVVVSEALARRWQREAEWGRYITAFNWCQWAVPVVGIALMVVLRLLVGAGLPPALAAPLVVLALAGYALSLQWFIARLALALRGGQAAMLVLGINLCSAAAVILPAHLRLLLDGGA